MTEEERLEKVKADIASIRADLVIGVEHPAVAAQQMCIAMLVVIDLVDFLITEAEEE